MTEQITGFSFFVKFDLLNLQARYCRRLSHDCGEATIALNFMKDDIYCIKQWRAVLYAAWILHWQGIGL